MTRLAPPTLAAALFVAALVSPASVDAQEHSTILQTAPVSPAALELQSPPALVQAAGGFDAPRPTRPDALMPLYLTYATLQVLDVHSTIRALDRGAVEANPLMKNLTESPASLVAVKAASAAGVLYTTEKLW